MNRYYISNLLFEIPVGKNDFEMLEANVEVFVSKDVWGDDADGNRGIWVAEKEAQILEVRNLDGEPVKDTPEMWEEVQRLVNEGR